MHIVGRKAHPSGSMNLPKGTTVKSGEQVDFPLETVIHYKGIFLGGIVDPNGHVLHPVPDGMKLPEEISRLVAVVPHRNGISGLDFLQRLGNGDKLGLI